MLNSILGFIYNVALILGVMFVSFIVLLCLLFTLAFDGLNGSEEEPKSASASSHSVSS